MNKLISQLQQPAEAYLFPAVTGTATAAGNDF